MEPAEGNSRNVLILVLFAAVTFALVLAGHGEGSEASAPFSIEGEALLGWADATEGQLVSQPAPGFSGDAQLLWTPERVGPALRLDAVVSRPGRYEVELVLAVGPDRGRFEWSLDGSEPVVLDGYSTSAGRLQWKVGTFELAPGPHELRFRVAGKHASSSAYRLGIDRVELRKSPR